jgi:predicted Holliday junction resolvase-like endonuclease
LIYIIVFLSLLTVVLIFVLGFKENRIHSLEDDIIHQKNSMEILGKEFNKQEEVLKHETKCLSEVNKIVDFYRGRYGFLTDEDVKFVLEKWKKEELGDGID